MTGNENDGKKLTVEEELRQDPTISQWLDTILKKPNTERNYLLGLKRYLDFTGMSPDALLDEAEDEAAKHVRPRKSIFLQRLIAYQKYLEQSDYAATTKRLFMASVKSFYQSAFIPIPKLYGLQSSEPKEENGKLISKEDIRETLKVCDPLERAVVLTGISAGLAEADIINLKVKDFIAGYDEVTGITTLKLNRMKTGIKFNTFLTPEATQSILDYLEFRNRPLPHGIDKQRINQLKKQHVESEEGYLFVLRSIPDKYLETKDEELRKFKVRTFTKLYEHLSEKCGRKNPYGYNVVRSHNMRKYFVSTLRNNGFELAVINHLAGHKEKAVDRAYYWADAEKLKEQYKKFVPYLTIQKEADISESPEYLRIKQENLILAAETARHVVERSELQELRAELEKMKEAREGTDKVTEIVLQLQKTDPTVLNTLLEALKSVKS